MNYDESTFAHYRIWISNRQKVIKHYKVTFSKNKNWENASLNLKMITLNVLNFKRFVDRSRKIAIVTLDVVINSNVVFELMIIKFAKVTSINTKNWQTFNVENHDFEAIFEISSKFHLNFIESKNYVDDVNDSFEINELIVEFTIHIRTKLTIFTMSSLKKMQQFLHVVILKRKRIDFTNENERDEHRDKIARVMFALLNEKFDVIETKKWTLIVVVNNSDKKFVDKLVIFVFESYEQTIKNSIWEQLWKKIIQIELIVLIFNDIWKVVVSSKEVNLMTSK